MYDQVVKECHVFQRIEIVLESVQVHNAESCRVNQKLFLQSLPPVVLNTVKGYVTYF